MTGEGAAPGLSSIPREARRFQGTPAGIVTRFVANSIDALVVAVVLCTMYLGYSAIIFMLDPRTFEFPAVTFLASLTVALVVATLYLWLAWWLLGRSYGAHVMGIRVAGCGGAASSGRCGRWPEPGSACSSRSACSGASSAPLGARCRTSCSSPRSSMTGGPARPPGSRPAATPRWASRQGCRARHLGRPGGWRRADVP